MITIEAGTLADLEECLAAEFKSLFAGKTYMNSIGHRVELKAFVHSLPVKQGDDDTQTDDDLPEPYIVSEVTGGKQQTEDSAHVVTAAVVICVCDDNTAGTDTRTCWPSSARCWRGSARTPPSLGSSSSSDRSNGRSRMRTPTLTTTAAS